MFSYLPRDLNFIEHTSNTGWQEFQGAKPLIIDPELYTKKQQESNLYLRLLYAYLDTSMSKSRESYVNADCVAEKGIAQVRTVYSIAGESKALNSYSEAVQNTLKLGYKAGVAKGLGIGCTCGIACMSWALLFWYAFVLLGNGQPDGEKAFTEIFSAIVGGMSLGQSFSNLEAFSKGKAAGYKLRVIIFQKPSIIQDSNDGVTADLAGDGTTTSDVLAQGLMAEGVTVTIVATGASPVQITRDVVAVGAGNNYELRNIIADAMSKVGGKGVLGVV